MEVPVMCCPLDVQRCSQSHAAHVICGECAAPLCMKCIRNMLRHKKIPMAIANHNYIGYCYDTLVKYKVRWIEAAVVCPVWTTLMCYYIEEDRGHVMQEELFRGKHRMAVRGNIFSFPMPWNEIMKSLLNATATPNLTVPHPPEMLAHMVRLHLNFGTSAQIPPLKEVCVRT